MPDDFLRTIDHNGHIPGGAPTLDANGNVHVNAGIALGQLISKILGEINDREERIEKKLDRMLAKLDWPDS